MSDKIDVCPRCGAYNDFPCRAKQSNKFVGRDHIGRPHTMDRDYTNYENYEVTTMERLMPRQCPQCDCELYTVIMNADNEAVAVECNMCGMRFEINVPRVMTLNEAAWLGELIRGVERNLKLRYYPLGTESADNPMIAVLRAFTHDGGGFWPRDADARDAFVWTSGFSEHWMKASDLLTALDNMYGKHGLEAPMAVIEQE
jgi:DNA-directed RNA polymerase subunit M/transcription elongation factor TFIIS